MKNTAKAILMGSIKPQVPQAQIIAVPIAKHLFSCLDDLNEAIQESQALGWLLLGSINGPEGGTWQDDVMCGMTALVGNTNKRLKQAAVSVQSQILATSKSKTTASAPQEVAS